MRLCVEVLRDNDGYIPDLVVQDLELLHVMLDLRHPLRFNLLFEPLMVGYIMVLNEDT